MADVSRAAELVLLAASGGQGPEDLTRRVAEALCEGLPVDGVTLSLLTHTPDRQLLHATSAEAVRLEELQFEVEEGPCLDASAHGRPVIVEDLHATVTEWPLFGILARERLTGVGAVFAFPLLDGGTSWGSADLLRRAVGPPDEETESAASEAVRAAALVLFTQGPVPLWRPGSAASTHWQRTHQAAGVMAQLLGIAVGEALARLRGRALATGRTLPSLAEDVLAQFLR
ncbi:GAF and ANTAR domain-containing protein [Streptomyces sp. CRN 30]|uniref:GAF domain-containing protein n=1 Tax=Streptomyces sp. CRN 30 TaxID=3075613 RepID=UPI002A80BB70|nr:GAF and ANTAR domain-containing protein [Streptomyces sp. CRN 30]